jgi:cytochrome c-type biogenesis protein CcmF
VLALAPVVREADRRFPRATPELQGLLIAAIAQRYESRPPPATFRLIVSPLVSWIWLGALILVGGALIALWPAPIAARARLRALGPRRAGGARAAGHA